MKAINYTKSFLESDVNFRDAMMFVSQLSRDSRFEKHEIDITSYSIAEDSNNINMVYITIYFRLHKSGGFFRYTWDCYRAKNFATSSCDFNLLIKI